MEKPVWVVLEGGDGAGKGIAGGVVKELFEALGMPLIKTREPGGTPEGEALRAMLLGESGSVWEKTSEIMLMTTSRVQHVARVIRPSIADGISVLCDRYVHSSVAYQGYGQQGPIDFIMRLHEDAVGGDMPDMTIILDIDPEIGIARAKRRLEEDGVDEGRMEAMEMAFHRRVRRGYLEMAAGSPDDHIVIDASQPIDQVRRDLRLRFGEWLAHRRGWTAWHGRYDHMTNRPEVPDAAEVMVWRRSGRIDGPYPAGRIEWHHQDVDSDILFYKLEKEA